MKKGLGRRESRTRYDGDVGSERRLDGQAPGEVLSAPVVATPQDRGMTAAHANPAAGAPDEVGLSLVPVGSGTQVDGCRNLQSLPARYIPFVLKPAIALFPPGEGLPSLATNCPWVVGLSLAADR